MKLNFYLRYSTQYGQSIAVMGAIPELGGNDIASAIQMQYVNDEFWRATIELSDDTQETISYSYILRNADGTLTLDWEQHRRLDIAAQKSKDIQVVDTWNDGSAVENAFCTQPFRDVLLRRSESTPGIKATAKSTHTFRIKAPLLAPNEVLCLLGSGRILTDWNTSGPLLMHLDGDWWTVRADLSRESFPLTYKYGIYDMSARRFVRYEDGSNRSLYDNGIAHKSTILHDGFARFPNNTWRGAGVAMPVFSLRTESGFGVGEFTDINTFADWAASVGMKLIQLLPVNDTAATGTWVDSYPYAAISAFALHPLYLNLDAVAGKKHAKLLKPFAALRDELNAKDAVDYEAVMTAKWEMARLLYAAQKDEFLKDADWQAYFEENKHWLQPYVAFCYFRDKFGTSDFNQWPEHSTFREEDIDQLVATHQDEVALHYFVQYHLHVQLQAATAYAHKLGIVVKGDLPIGIYRYSCDAWVAPELYNMSMQAGAPPDDFAENGQNWGFPTYNWDRMKADGFAWWRQRFGQMSYYFDVFRVDHILGFFRIWSIPVDAVQGILGYFVPAIPVGRDELYNSGVGFSYERLCLPYITADILNERFGHDALDVRNTFLQENGRGGYDFRPEFDTQRKVETYFATLADDDYHRNIRDGLYDLHANVILLQDKHGGLHFRYGIEKTTSFRDLPDQVKVPLKALYVNYFYRRQDDFWRREAMEKLPALKRTTDMLICGEDLGMVPDCVPGVMQELGLLSLEIQRMPKAPGSAFFHPADAPYLSVVTPGTHDMSTLRGWWEEDRSLTQRFYHDILHEHGHAPFFCEAWVNRRLIVQHLHSPAMWSIFQLQDLMGSDAAIRRENPNDERINVPANPKHYWRYRMHLTLADLQQTTHFNDELRNMVRESGR